MKIQNIEFVIVDIILYVFILALYKKPRANSWCSNGTLISSMGLQVIKSDEVNHTSFSPQCIGQEATKQLRINLILVR